MGILTDSQKIEVVDKYLNTKENASSLARMYGVSSSAIRAILKVRNIPKKRIGSKHDVDTSYFEKIDTEEKAYFLGLMYADGYNFLSGFSINLHEQDRDILEKFKKSLKYTGPFGKLINKKHKKDYPCLAVGSAKMARDLANLGCVKAKSKILTFPSENQVPRHLIRHFIRGYFDGDGSISVTKKGQWQCGICSTLMFIEPLSKVILSEIGVYCKPCTDCGSHELYRRICTGSKEKIFLLLSWLYRDSTVYLQRKHDKFLEFCAAACYRAI